MGINPFLNFIGKKANKPMNPEELEFLLYFRINEHFGGSLMRLEDWYEIPIPLTLSIMSQISKDNKKQQEEMDKIKSMKKPSTPHIRRR